MIKFSSITHVACELVRGRPDAKGWTSCRVGRYFVTYSENGASVKKTFEDYDAMRAAVEMG